MKLKEMTFEPGRCFVSKTEFFLRRLVRESPDGWLYDDFEFPSGKAMEGGLHSCSRQTLAGWALREATPEECARLSGKTGVQVEVEQMEKLRSMLLASCPDADLVAEIRLRKALGRLANVTVEDE